MTAILLALKSGPKHYTELLDVVGSAGVFPPSVIYSLAPASREALDAMQPLAVWVSRHTDIVDQARHRRSLDARRSA